MERRDFLRLTGAATASAAWSPAQAAPPPAGTVLYDDRTVDLQTIGDTGPTGELWILATDLPRINGFELKPEGACRADICIPIPPDFVRGRHFNLTAFARRIGQPVVSDTETRVWSLGEISAFRGDLLASRVAPDFAVPDRKGRTVRLSDFRNKKVLVITWASW